MNKGQLRHYLASSFVRRPLQWWRHRTLTRQDVLLASYPRSGNTWLRFLLYELLTGETADFETINAPHSPCADFPRVQQTPIMPPLHGRLIKTHEPYRHEYGRAIYLVRNPLDVAVSEYYYMQGRGLFLGSLTEFVEVFVRGGVHGYGAWHRHVASWLDAPVSDLLFVRYEDLREDGCMTLAKIGAFLGVETAVTQLEQIWGNNTPQAMRQAEEKSPRTAFNFTDETARFIRQTKENEQKEMVDDLQVAQIRVTMQPQMQRMGYG